MVFFADFLYETEYSAVSVMIDFISSYSSSGAFSVVLSDSNLFFISTAYRAGMLLVTNRRIAGGLLMVLNGSLTFAISSLMVGPAIGTRERFDCLYRTLPSLLAEEIVDLMSTQCA